MTAAKEIKAEKLTDAVVQEIAPDYWEQACKELMLSLIHI